MPTAVPKDIRFLRRIDFFQPERGRDRCELTVLRSEATAPRMLRRPSFRVRDEKMVQNMK